jgi:hypothetical protein
MIGSLLLAGALAAAPCEGLTSLSGADVTITSAQLIAAGPYFPTGDGGAGGRAAADGGARRANPAADGSTRRVNPAARGRFAPGANTLPEHCRVTAVIHDAGEVSGDRVRRL